MYDSYVKAKKKLKELLPAQFIDKLIIPFHFAEAFVANVINGFPSRSMRVIGITGTNGKTTTTLMTGHILREAGYTVGVNSTAQIWDGQEEINNKFALTTANPFQLQKLLKTMKKNGVDIVVMEVASHALSQGRVWGIDFETVAITNLTRDHLDYHKTMENYAAAKGKLFSRVPKISVLNRDDEWYDFFASYDAIQKITYGTHVDANCKITKASLSSRGSKIKMKLEDYDLDIALAIPGQYNAINALCAASITYGLDIKLDDIKNGLQGITEIPGRMQLIEEGQDFVVVVDHAHTEDAVDNLLRTLRATLKGRLITLIGADGDRDPGKREPLGRIAATYSELVVVADQEPYTEDPDNVRKAVLKGAQSVTDKAVVVKDVPDRREAIAIALRFAKKGDVVVIPGLGNQLTRGMHDGKMGWYEPAVVAEELQKLTKN